ncbi:uncharacterized protein LOC114527742 [Dendronephthya gigantea]|uniref:uncharacterized protein LOC114527742 n=1 Tax=Dendronephthya gigantea TaxID=151771 RepID=UPI00106C8DC4|nr:uncharacterized protein LOC114527742 [Dendronephthya gigantea]
MKRKENNFRFQYTKKVEEELNHICQWACFQKQNVVILGDLNLDRLKLDHAEGKILKDLEEINNLQCITEATRVTEHSESLLDVILTNNPGLFKKCGTYQPEMSDHHLVFAEMTEKVHKHKTHTITFRQTKHTDFEQLNRDLAAAPWHVGEIFSNVNNQYDYWKGLLKSMVDLHAPIQKKRVRERDIPYMTPEWKQAIRNKRKFAIQFAKDRSPDNYELKRKYRNIATRERRKAIKSYWLRKSEELKSKPGEFFNTFKPFISSKTKDTNVICLKSDDEEVEKDQKVVAELLADHFNTVAANIGGNHVINLSENDHRNHSSIRIIESKHRGNKFEFNDFSKEEVQSALENLNLRKSYGWDVTALPKLLKGMAPSLTRLYNKCINSGEWPSEWKRGEWTPVFKKGNRQDKMNYRPITSLICVNKIFEQILSKQ